MPTDRPIPRRPPNVNDPQRPNRPISAADAAAEPPAERTFPPSEEVDLPTSLPGGPPPAQLAQAAPRPGVAFTVHCLLDDFPIDVSFSGSAAQLRATVDRLRELGAVPPTPAARQAVEAEKARTAPICEFHGAMKESSKAPGSFYCPAKMGDGSYCKSKA